MLYEQSMADTVLSRKEEVNTDDGNTTNISKMLLPFLGVLSLMEYVLSQVNKYNMHILI